MLSRLRIWTEDEREGRHGYETGGREGREVTSIARGHNKTPTDVSDRNGPQIHNTQHPNDSSVGVSLMPSFAPECQRRTRPGGDGPRQNEARVISQQQPTSKFDNNKGASPPNETKRNYPMKNQIIMPNIIAPHSNSAVFIQIPWPRNEEKTLWTITELWHRTKDLEQHLECSDDCGALYGQWIPVLRTICEQATAVAKQEEQMMARDLKIFKTVIRAAEGDTTWPSDDSGRPLARSEVQEIMVN